MIEPTRLAVVAAAPEEFWIGDEGPFKFGPLSYRALGELDRVLIRQSKTPIQVIGPQLASVPEPERTQLWNQALEASKKWQPPSVGSFDGNALLIDDPDCSDAFLRLALRAYNPQVTEEDIQRLACKMTRLSFVQISKVCLEVSDPKVLLLTQGESMTAEDRESLEKFCNLQEKLSSLRSPLRWITPLSSAGSARPPASG